MPYTSQPLALDLPLSWWKPTVGWWQGTMGGSTNRRRTRCPTTRHSLDYPKLGIAFHSSLLGLLAVLQGLAAANTCQRFCIKGPTKAQQAAVMPSSQLMQATFASNGFVP